MRLAQDEFANRSQNIVKFRKICYSFANCEFFSAKWGCIQAKWAASLSFLTPHLTPHTSRVSVTCVTIRLDKTSMRNSH